MTYDSLSERRDGQVGKPAPRTSLARLLAGLAGISESAYLAVVSSSQSLHETGTGGHSLLTLLALFAVAFGAYLVAIRIANRAPQNGRLLSLIVGAGIVFRLTLLFSDPIEEIDLYRYLWDGSVLNQGVSPFRYSPHQVLAAQSESDLPDELARLVRLRDKCAGDDDNPEKGSFRRAADDLSPCEPSGVWRMCLVDAAHCAALRTHDFDEGVVCRV